MNAINSLKDATFKSGQMAAQGNADAKARRPEMLLELADAHLFAKQPQQAAQVYDQIINEKLLPSRAEEVLQRAATAYHLAGDVNNSEARVASFKQQFPNSPLLPLVLFRSAENSFVKAEKLAKQNNAAGAKTDLHRGRGQVRRGHQEVPRVRARESCTLRAWRSASPRRKTGIRPSPFSKRSLGPSATTISRRCRTCWPIASSAPRRRRPRTRSRTTCSARSSPPRRRSSTRSSPRTRRPTRRPTRF